MATTSWLKWVMTASLVALVAACGSDRRGGPGTSSNESFPTDNGPNKLDPNDLGFEEPEDNMSDAPSSGVCEAMDILFVIDDSGSMEPAQMSLKENFPRFMQVLSEFENDQGKQLDYRVAVTTTSVTYSERVFGETVEVPGNDGALIEGCDLQTPYVTRDLQDVAASFSCLASVGTSGSGLEMPVEALLMSLEKDSAFFRGDALLAVVVLTDEDDCSRTDRVIDTSTAPLDALLDPAALEQWMCGPDKVRAPDEIAKTLDAFKGDRSKWALSVIGWHPDDTSCEDRLHQQSKPAEQLASVVDHAGENAIFSSICQDDLSGALTDAMNNFNFACESFLR